MEFEISRSIPKSIAQSSSEIQGDAVSSPPPVPPQYFIAKDKPRRNVRPPQRYGEADLVAYALNGAEGIDSSEELST